MNVTVTYPDEFDEALRENRRAGDEIRLIPGKAYETAGNWVEATPPYANLAKGVSLICDGGPQSIATVRLTNPKMDPGSVRRPNLDANVLWGGGDHVIRNITFDANHAGNPGIHVGGVRILGDLKAQKVSVAGLRGSWNSATTPIREIEVFGLVVTGQAQINGFRISGCHPNSYVSGLYLANQDPSKSSFANDIKIDLGSNNWFGVSAGVNVKFDDVELSGCRVAFYNDTGNTDRVTICFLDATCGTLVGLKPQAAFPTQRMGTVRIRDSVVAMAPDSAGDCRLVERWNLRSQPWDRPSDHMGSVLIENSTIHAPDGVLHIAPTVGPADPVILIDTSVTAKKVVRGSNVIEFA